MAPNSWRYLVAFLWECYVSGIRVTRELLIACFRLSQGQVGSYLAARSGFRVSAGAGLRKCLRKVAAEQPTDASGSTARTSADKGKGMVELEEVPEQGYTMWELCEVEDRVGVNKYFTSIMTRLKCTDSEDPLVLRWSTISGSRVGQELVAAAEWWAKELEGEFEKIQTELESLRSQQRELEQEIGLLHSSLDGARNDRACLEGDVLSLTEPTVFLEAELKVEGQKAWPPTRHPEGSSLASRR
ncbi:hypothetical protein BHE74_00020349 [Ensete ventricosum]|nr:hypothetical protein BHE74_00020349 [Ensete ventricosum]